MMTLSIWEQFGRQFSLRWGELLVSIGEHIQLVLLSMIIAILIGVPAGILVTRFSALRSWIIGGASVLQTIPSLALLGFMIPILGIGTKTAVAALFLYSLLPIIRNTYTGIKDVDPSVIEAARGWD